ncbi:MAG: CDGSH iron-sulfur domain-containing protein [Methyloligellaceae bacterium]
MADDPVPAQLGPYEFEVEEGKRYAWCRCGRSKKQPLCDGSHKETDLEPVVFTAEKTETVYLCGCKDTGDEPFCDGSHLML